MSLLQLPVYRILKQKAMATSLWQNLLTTCQQGFHNLFDNAVENNELQEVETVLRRQEGGLNTMYTTSIVVQTTHTSTVHMFRKGFIVSLSASFNLSPFQHNSLSLFLLPHREQSQSLFTSWYYLITTKHHHPVSTDNSEECAMQRQEALFLVMQEIWQGVRLNWNVSYCMYLRWTRFSETMN